MFEDLQEEMINPLFKKNLWNLKQTMEWNEENSYNKMEIESTKKTQFWVKQKMKNLESQTKTSKVKLTNRVQEMEERISGIEDKIEEMDTSVKQNVKYKKFQAQNIQET